MGKIPLDAKVECIDGACGESVTVIVNPTTRQVTHFVVRYKDLPHPNQRLVPIDDVLDTSSSLIRLRCTREQLAGMEPFLETQYIRTEQPVPTYEAYDSYMFPYVTQTQAVDVAVEVERVPSGELAVHRGTQVEAVDGHVGEVGELVVDPDSGDITHLILREGHLWGKKEVMLPVSAIDYVEEDTVVLKLDKKAVELLPVIPVKREYAEGKADIVLMAKVFDTVDQADRALDFVEDLHRHKTIKILNAAVLVKDEDGTTSLKDTRDIEPKRGRLLGAVTGGLLGLAGGPAGVVVGALVGAGAGGLAARKLDFGFSDEFLENLQTHLQPGNSALVLLAEHKWAADLHNALSDGEGVVFQQTLSDALVEELLKETGDEKE
jgi:uncharacterized membrane protein/sporulation protein YlmC with PRC-barrel domain